MKNNTLTLILTMFMSMVVRMSLVNGINRRLGNNLNIAKLATLHKTNSFF